MQDLKVVVLQRTVVSSFGCFVFELWVLRFRVLGASFSRFGYSVFESWVLRFRDLGALCFGLRFQVLRFRNYPPARHLWYVNYITPFRRNVSLGPLMTVLTGFHCSFLVLPTSAIS